MIFFSNVKRCYVSQYSILIIVLILTVIAFRLPVFIPFSWKFDELDYLTGARELLNGEVLYSTYGDLKPPMIFWIYASVCFFAGEINIYYIKILGIFITVVTSLTIFCLGSKAEKSPLGFIAAFLFAGYSICARGEEMLAANSEMMMNLFIVPAYILFFVNLSKNKNIFILILGSLLLSFAFFTNQKAGINLIVFCLIILLQQKTQYPWGKKIKDITVIISVFLWPIIIFLNYYYFIGYLDQIIFWLYEIPNSYINSFGFSARLERLSSRSINFFQGYFPLFIPFFYSLACLIRKKLILKPFWLGMILWFLFSYYAVFVGGKMMERYFIQILPPFFIITAFGILEIYNTLVGKLNRFATAFVFVILFSIYPARYFIDHIKTDEITLDEITENANFQQIIGYIRANTSIKDTIFVFPKDKYYYYFSNRRIGTRFNEIETHLWIPRIYPEVTVVFQKGWDYLFSDLEQRAPKIIIDGSGNFGKSKRDPVHIRNKKRELEKFILNNYKKVGAFGDDILYIRKNKLRAL